MDLPHPPRPSPNDPARPPAATCPRPASYAVLAARRGAPAGARGPRPGITTASSAARAPPARRRPGRGSTEPTRRRPPLPPLSARSGAPSAAEDASGSPLARRPRGAAPGVRGSRKARRRRPGPLAARRRRAADPPPRSDAASAENVTGVVRGLQHLAGGAGHSPGRPPRSGPRPRCWARRPAAVAPTRPLCGAGRAPAAALGGPGPSRASRR